MKKMERMCIELRYAIKVTGVVQGVGFRYYVSQSATHLGLTGWVKNEWDSSVSIEAQGSIWKLNRFLKDVQHGNRWAEVDPLKYQTIPDQHGERGFQIHF
jgi:acylphosphatase